MDEASAQPIEPGSVAAARAGDTAARAALYRLYAGRIYTLARRMLGSAALAEDVLQDTFVEVFTKLDELRDDAAFGAWARKIAVNRALSQLRSSWESKRVDWPDETAHAAQCSVESAIDGARLQAALDSLPAAARVVVWLYDVEGYTHREIAELTGRSVSYSKTRLARAHASLRQMLADAPVDANAKDEAPLRATANEGSPICVGELKTI